MDLETLEKMANSCLENMSEWGDHVDLKEFQGISMAFKFLVDSAHRVLSNYREYLKEVSNNIEDFGMGDARSTVKYIQTIIAAEKNSLTKTKELKIFENADVKMKQAALSFRKEDYSSTFRNLNTALELVLKDKLGIPTTITKINTSNIIDVLAKHKVEPYLYLNEARKRIVMIDNKIKHQGYSPSKTDCISGMKVMEELISRLRDKEIKLTEEVRNKIYQGL